MAMRQIDVVLVSVNLPILCGLYENNLLIEEIRSDELLLVGLPRIFEYLLPTAKQNPAYRSFKVDSIYYANGPGSFSALKLTHIFLHTLSMIHNIKIFATSSFDFTHNPYIKAFGTNYFYRNQKGEISLVQQKEMQHQDICFFLPQTLNKNIFNAKTQPLYILPPV